MAEAEDEDSQKLRLSYDSGPTIPFCQNKLVCVEYPGYVENVDKMLDTLRGEEKLSETYRNEAQRCELFFRPEDPYDNAAYGDRVATTNVLLRVKRRRKKRKNGEPPKPEDVQTESEILGVVDTTYRFQNLMDFQCLPVGVPDDCKEIAGIDFYDNFPPLFLPPPIMSRMDRPLVYNYRPEPRIRSKAGPILDNPDPERISGANPRRRRPAYAIGINFTTKDVPTDPLPEALQTESKYRDNKREEMAKLFQDRPIWSRNALMGCLNITRERLKTLLAVTAYYWLTGPWRTLWTRLGYDPRTDNEARRYEAIDFRLRENSKFINNIPVKLKRNTLCLPNIMRRSNTSAVTPKSNFFEDNPEKDQEESRENLPFVFTGNTLPMYRQTIYQICDIYDPDVQALLRDNEGQVLRCSEKEGWYIPGTRDRVRKVMVDKVSVILNRMKEEEKNASRPAEEKEESTLEEQDELGFLEMLQNEDENMDSDSFGESDDDG